MDVLSDVIATMRAGQPHASRQLRYSPWGFRFPEVHKGAGFHAVLEGSCWVVPSDGSPRLRVDAGEVVFAPHGIGYTLADDPATDPTEVRPLPDGSWPSSVTAGNPTPGSPPSAVMLCGAYRLHRERAHPLLGDLPGFLRLPARGRPLGAVLDLLQAELERPRPGLDATIPALLDIALIHILRARYEEQAEHTVTGWASALADPAIAAALAEIHGHPEHPWTVEELGGAAGLSRAAFARRFSVLVGEPPLGYLTWWRLTVAGRLLRESDLPLRAIAGQTGYTTEFAFAKAFKREYGTAPGRYRAEHRGRPGPAGTPAESSAG